MAVATSLTATQALVESQSVTCHLAEVAFSSLPQPKLGDARLSLANWLVTYRVDVGLTDAVVPRDWETGMQCTAMQWEYAVLVMQLLLCLMFSSA